MNSGLVLAIDQGTTNTKALVFDQAGRVAASASTPTSVTYPRPGWAEQSAEGVWAAVQKVITEVVGIIGPNIDALAIANQRETVVVWEAQSGRPIGPAIIWQCRRSADRCEAIRRAGHADLVERKTGLALDPLFPAAKIAWLLDSVQGAREAAEAGQLRAGTIDTWLLWNMTGGEVHATDHSNASRTQLFNTRTLAWDPELCGIFDVPLAILAPVRSSDSRFGAIGEGATALAAGTPVRAMIGDSHAALFGHGVREPGTVKGTYGTGTSLMTLTPARTLSHHGLSSTIAWSTSSGIAYALEGNISVSGQSAAFMAEMLGIDDVALLAEMAASVPDTNGVSFVPALVGLGAPYWSPAARGLVSGLSLGTSRAHLARAAIEAIAFQVSDVFSAMESDLGRPLFSLSADGGASRNDMLMQFQADLIGRPVMRGELAEVSAMGAAMLAFEALGKSVPSRSEPPKTFVPKIDAATRGSLLVTWHEAVGRTLGQPRANT